MTGRAPGGDDDELLALPGVIRAPWWSICHVCGHRIEERDVVVLGYADGTRWWLCRTCGPPRRDATNVSGATP